MRVDEPVERNRQRRKLVRAGHCNIPAGGPYFVSVRAANGTAYATLPSAVKVGLILDLWGQGQSAGITAGANGGLANSTYTGLWGVNSPSGGSFYSYDTGPALATNLYPSWTQMLGGDQLSVTGGIGEPLPEGASSILQNLQNSMGYPATLSEWVRDGAALTVFVWGNQVQSQSIGIGQRIDGDLVFGVEFLLQCRAGRHA